MLSEKTQIQDLIHAWDMYGIHSNLQLLLEINEFYSYPKKKNAFIDLDYVQKLKIYRRAKLGIADPEFPISKAYKLLNSKR